MNSGFTLVEMAVGLLITGFLLLSAGSVYFIAVKTYTRAEDINYKKGTITNIETVLQNSLATATEIKTDFNAPVGDQYYGLGFNSEGECVEVIDSIEYKTDQITKIVLKNNGNILNYELFANNSMSVIRGGIVMNNIYFASIDETLMPDQEKYFVVTLIN